MYAVRRKRQRLGFKKAHGRGVVKVIHDPSLEDTDVWERPQTDDGKLLPRIMFMDDNLLRHDTFRQYFDWAAHVKTVSEAIGLLQTYSFDLLFLDHDLGGKVYVDPLKDGTGGELARWIVANPIEVQRIYLHSHHDKGALYMNKTLVAAGYDVIWTPFDEIVWDKLKNQAIL
jgi:hypothetical protein